MSRPVITVENLSKSYRLGHRTKLKDSFREAIIDTVSSPFRHLRRTVQNGTISEEETFWALKDVSFEVERGEVVGIIGRNGAGKSTLLKILSRITEPTQGSIHLRGRVASLLEVGTGFHPELTGRENVYLNGSILGMKKAEIDRKFDEIVAFAEIERFLDTPVKRYSSGMYVRLAFSVAAHLDPEILIVDEVLAVGDTAFQQKCLGKMQDVTRRGRTVLFVSHNMAAVRSLCQTSCVIERGRLAFVGGVNECINHYLHDSHRGQTRPSMRFSPPSDLAAPWMRTAVLTSGGLEASQIKMGDAMTLIVEFESLGGLHHPKLGLTISDDQGQTLLNANNRYQPCNDIGTPCTKGAIHCDLGVIPLMPGRYTISLWFGDFAHDSHVVDDALSFEVVEHDAWGLGHVPPICSALWWPTRFQIESSSLIRKPTTR